jgi:hypothetical protein
MQSYVNNCEDYYVGMKRTKEIKTKVEEVEVLLDQPDDMDPSIPNAPFESDDDQSEVDPSCDHLYLDKNIEHVDLPDSTIDDLDDIPAAFTIAHFRMLHHVHSSI